MLRTYFRTALRSLLRSRSHSLVNIIGLAVGFSTFILLFLVLTYEQSFDDFHTKKQRIYRVVREDKGPAEKGYHTGVPFPATQSLRDDYPQLERAAAIMGESNVQVTIPGAEGQTLKKFKERKGVFFAEPEFFDLFDFKIVEGTTADTLRTPNTALLTKDFAAKYFGDWRTAVGKIVKAYGHDLTVTAILDNPPVNTDFPLGMVISYPTLKALGAGMNDWTGIEDNNYCFVLLQPGNVPRQLETQLKTFVSRHIPSEHAGYNLILQPLNDLHFDNRLNNFNSRTFSRDLIIALRLIGIFLLIIACVNFINLSTAQAVNRAREVGVRKVMGGRRSQLLLHFLGETGFTCLIAMFIAMILSLIALPFLDRLLDLKMTLSTLNSPSAMAFMACIWLTVTLLSGSYPALVLSGFNPINALKGNKASGTDKGITLRRGLVILQFTIAQILIIGTLVVVAQTNYFRNADMGFTTTAIVNARMPNDSASQTKMDVLRHQLLQTPGIKAVSFSLFTPAGNEGWWTDLKWAANHTEKADLIVNMKLADPGYFSIYHLQLAAGRIYFPSDTTAEYVVNETVVKKLGIKNPAAAIGQRINVAGRTCPIVGVVKDFHIKSLREPIFAVVMTTGKDAYGMTNIQIEQSKAKPALTMMKDIWNKLYPDYMFEYNFMDQTIAGYYKQEDQLSQLYQLFAGIAIFISCLGLYGLISFMTVQRRKEIGIRKVLGAPVSSIILMLSREFTFLITLSFLIASPVAWYFTDHWLRQYSFRIEIGIGFFAITLLFSILISWITAGHSAVRAAIANPVKSLRTE
jgi:ABC-type antimicrobial peptide transport system permease subunit